MLYVERGDAGAFVTLFRLAVMGDAGAFVTLFRLAVMGDVGSLVSLSDRMNPPEIGGQAGWTGF